MRQRGDWRFVELVEEPGYGCEVAAKSTQPLGRIEFEAAIGQPPTGPVYVNVVQCLLVAAGATSMGDGLVERREVFERRRPAFPRCVTQVLVKAAMRGAPSLGVRFPQPLAE